MEKFLGIGAQSLNIYQAALRAVIVYIAILVMVRVGEKRFLGKSTAFDFVVAILLGSLISNAISLPDGFLPTIIAGFVLVGLHWVFAYITYQSNWLDDFLKGMPRQLVKNGEILSDEMKKNNITTEDLAEDVRIEGKTENLQSVKTAYLERSGDISVIRFPRQPKVLEVKVEEGVQTIRIVLDSWTDEG